MGTAHLTPAASEVASIAGVQTSFAQSAEITLQKLCGLRLGESTVERVTEAAGERLATLLEEKVTFGENKPWTWQHDARGKTCAYVSLDATGVRQQGAGGAKVEGRMAYVGMLYNPRSKHDPQPPPRHSMRYLAGFYELNELGSQLRRQAAQVGWDDAEQQIALSDGGHGLEEFFRKNFPLAECILDFWHAAEHLTELGLALYPDDEAERHEHVGAWCHQLKHEGGATTLSTLETIEVSGCPHSDVLAAAGCQVHYPARPVLLTEDDTLVAMQGCVAALAGSEPYTERVLRELPDLRVIARNGVGYDQIDVEAATRRGIAVTITPQGNHQAVAEHAMALLLAVTRNVVQNAIETRRGNWPRRRAFIPLRGKTLGIVGLGRIGRSLAQRAAGFGVRIIACEMQPDRDFVARLGIELVDLETLLARADFVSLHAPMTGETRQLINRRTLALMRPGSVLINTARGGLVNEADLAEALQSGHLAGAGLDVLSVEPPPPDHPLLGLDNVIVSPHVAAFDEQARQDMALAAARNIVEVLAGRWPRESMVNPELAPPAAAASRQLQ